MLNFCVSDILLEVVFDRAEQLKILDCVHSGVGDSKTSKAQGGHCGVNTVNYRLRQRYYWLGMTVDVKRFIESCPQCQPNKPAVNLKAPQKLHPVKIPYGQPWSQIGIDLLGPLHEINGYKYILTAICYFTKWTELTPLRSKSAIEVADALYTMMCRFGCPQIHISDQGREFVNSISKSLLERSGTTHKITSAYHPRSNGLVERQNRTTLSTLRKLISEEEGAGDWLQCLPPIQMSVNSAWKGAVGFTPYQLMFGRQMRLPVDVQNEQHKLDHEANSDLGSEEENNMIYAVSEKNQKDLMIKMKEIQTEMYEKAEHTNRKYVAKMKKNWDAKHTCGPSFPPGTKVYRQNKRHNHRMGGKLDPKYLKSTYSVIDYNECTGTYKLYDSRNGKELKNRVPADQIKKHVERDELLLASPPVLTSSASMEVPDNDMTKVPTEEHEGIVDVVPQTILRPLISISKKRRQGIISELGMLSFIIPSLPNGNSESTPSSCRPTGPDGNCYFRAISYIICGSESQHMMLRRSIINHMKTPSVARKIADYLGIPNVSTYISSSKMEMSSVWATEVEIFATASLLKCDINVYSVYSSSSMEWQLYPASFNLNETTTETILLQNSENHFEPVISL